VNYDDKRIGMLLLLRKFDVVGVRCISFSIRSRIVGHVPPPLAIQCAVSAASLNYLQFVPRSKYEAEDWVTW
jgi:hypothetical protein